MPDGGLLPAGTVQKRTPKGAAIFWDTSSRVDNIDMTTMSSIHGARSGSETSTSRVQKKANLSTIISSPSRWPLIQTIPSSRRMSRTPSLRRSGVATRRPPSASASRGAWPGRCCRRWGRIRRRENHRERQPAAEENHGGGGRESVDLLVSSFLVL